LDVVALGAASVAPSPPPAKIAAAAPDHKASDIKSAASGSDSAAPAPAHIAAQAPVAATSHTASDGSDSDSNAANTQTANTDASSSAPKTPDANTAAFNPVAPQTTANTGAAPLAAAAHPAPIPDQIASQIAAKTTGASSRFDIALDPAGLGHVNVSVQINAAGQVTAALTFDNPHAAAEAKNGAGALQHALEQAGFNVAQGGLSFNSGGQGANLARQETTPQNVSARFASAIETPPETLATLSGAYGASRASSGVDITI
jgi:hypothetical protein